MRAVTGAGGVCRVRERAHRPRWVRVYSPGQALVQCPALQDAVGGCRSPTTRVPFLFLLGAVGCCVRRTPPRRNTALYRSAAPQGVRLGGVELVGALCTELGFGLVPYVVLLLVPLLRRMSDPKESVRRWGCARCSTWRSCACSF